LLAVLPAPPAQDTLVQVLSYHVVPGQALLLGDLQDGDVLQTLVPGPEGQLEVRPARAVEARGGLDHVESMRPVL
jgi:uncharacterized surface protein with fasciclin (FAS1) repeats